MILTEPIVEDAALPWFGELAYCCLWAEALTPILSEGERKFYHEAVLVGQLRAALRQIRPKIPGEAREEALRNVLRMYLPSMGPPTPTNPASWPACLLPCCRCC